jgi:hypothetical protein
VRDMTLCMTVPEPKDLLQKDMHADGQDPRARAYVLPEMNREDTIY